MKNGEYKIFFKLSSNFSKYASKIEISQLKKLRFYIRNIVSPRFFDSPTCGTPKSLKTMIFYVEIPVF